MTALPLLPPPPRSIAPNVDDDVDRGAVDDAWAACRTLTASVLPVRVACDCACRFCFSKSSISSLAFEKASFADIDVDAYCAFAKAKGATRFVITGGGEPLLLPDVVVELVARARAHFSEVCLFTNGARLARTPGLARALRDAGLSYLCWSRHHDDDDANRAIMGDTAPDAKDVLAAVAGLFPMRLTTVMTTASIAGRADAFRLLRHFAKRGIDQFTFKHTYVPYDGSVFAGAAEDGFAAAHAVNDDPFVDDDGPVVLTLPWGPRVRAIDVDGVATRTAFYFEPTPAWEKEHRLCRSLNLLSDGHVFASLEERSSRLCRCLRSPTPS